MIKKGFSPTGSGCSTVSSSLASSPDRSKAAKEDAAAAAAAPGGKSKWKKLLAALRKSSPGGGGGGGSRGGGSSSGGGGANVSPEEAYRLKHSHNCSNAVLRAGVSNMKGYKKANQDRCTAFSYLENDPDLAFFGVYDGHGGTGVANYLKDHLHQFILDQQEYKEGNMEEAILKAFLQVDQELRSYGQATELTGSTATIVMIKHGELFVANLGDSRATACVLGLSKPLTCDHNTGNVKERERVFAMGGIIKDNRVGGVLIPTRSFGDFLLKSEMDKPAWKQVISAVPQIQSFRLNANWEFVVVASDGVWDAMSNQEAIGHVRNRIKEDPQLILSELCEEMLDKCCARTVERFGKNSCDNMTIIIVCLDHKDEEEDRSSSVVTAVAGASQHRRQQQQHNHCDKSSGSSSAVSSVVSR